MQAPLRGPVPHVPAPNAAPAPHRDPRAIAASGPGLEFDVDPVGAEVLVDGQPHGTVAEIAAAGGVLALSAGIYQVSLRANGRVTWRAEVAVRSGRERIQVKLQTRP